MSNATTHKFSGWDCAKCGLPLTVLNAQIGVCPCGSTRFVLDCDEED